MRRNALVAIAIAGAMLLGAIPATALAWSNGPAKKGHAGDGYGTHDWILDRAIKLAGANGTWVIRTTALLATDDPDSQRTPSTYHWYSDSGSLRGAPQMVSELYHQAIVAYQAGDRVAASRYLGTLSHYYDDITQPFHTTSKALPYGALHNRYEYAVDDHQNTPAKSRSWVTARPTVPVTDIRSKTVDAALYARSLFPRLLASYKRSRSVTKGTTNKVTRLVMSRAVNDLADIISSIPSGVGEATAPAAVDMSLSATNPRPTQRLGTLVTITDANGAPINAVGVKFEWRLPTGTVTWLTFTDANGYAYRYQTISSLPFLQQAFTTTYVTVNGTTTATDRWFMRVN
ncbi:MAG TPA: hypothetical protein VIL17_07665 [Coriobacteriia bacterium]